jgi:hypothetical protein
VLFFVLCKDIESDVFDFTVRDRPTHDDISRSDPIAVKTARLVNARKTMDQQRIIQIDEDDDDLLELAIIRHILRRRRSCRDKLDLRFFPGDNRSVVHRGGPLNALLKAHGLLEGDPTRFFNLFRYSQDHFLRLTTWLEENTDLQGSRYQSIEQKVMILLYVLGQGCTQAQAAHFFECSQSTISSVMDKGLEALRLLFIEFVRQPPESYVAVEPMLNSQWHHFKGCIGAIDGTHIKAHIPLHDQRKWYDRHGVVSQNVLAVVDLSGRFLYVLAGAEGSINDAQLIRFACSASFKLPTDRYYVADAGFGARGGILLPYVGTRYHLDDWAAGERAPETAKELYNLRHSRLRIIVEQTFGRVKRKFRILRSSPPEYDILKQVLIVYACCGLWNFLKDCTKDDIDEETAVEVNAFEEEIRAEVREWADRYLDATNTYDLRDRIATAQWEEYEEIRAERDEQWLQRDLEIEALNSLLDRQGARI